MGLEIIRQKAKERNMTRAEISRRSGVPIDTLNKIISGAIKAPKYYQVEAIAHALGYKADFTGPLDDVQQNVDMSDAELDTGLFNIVRELVDVGSQLPREEQEQVIRFLKLSSRQRAALIEFLKTLELPEQQ